MAKKKTSLSQTLFGEINPYGNSEESPAETAQIEKQTKISIEMIRPDPDQPRQLLPLHLSQAVASGRITPAEALQTWLDQVNEADDETTHKHGLHELKRLAMSIEQHGLINPITVRLPQPGESLPARAQYFIVTGERRYWSHVLLMLEGRKIREGNEIITPDQIKALVVNEGVSIRAHQLIENLLREDINAVEKARGLWALRYELSGVNRGSPLAVGSAAQDGVNRGSPPYEIEQEEKLVPWSKIEETLGISKRYRIFVTSVLNLCSEAQQLVDSHDLSERLIRPIVQKLRERPDLQVEALRQVISWREENEAEDGPERSTVTSTQDLVDQLLGREETKESRAAPAKTARPVSRRLGTDQFRSKVQGALRFLNKLEEPDLAGLIQDLTATNSYSGAIEDLRDLRERIDTILEAIAVQGGKNKQRR